MQFHQQLSSCGHLKSIYNFRNTQKLSRPIASRLSHSLSFQPLVCSRLKENVRIFSSVICFKYLRNNISLCSLTCSHKTALAGKGIAGTSLFFMQIRRSNEGSLRKSVKIKPYVQSFGNRIGEETLTQSIDILFPIIASFLE